MKTIRTLALVGAAFIALDASVSQASVWGNCEAQDWAVIAGAQKLSQAQLANKPFAGDCSSKNQGAELIAACAQYRQLMAERDKCQERERATAKAKIDADLEKRQKERQKEDAAYADRVNSCAVAAWALPFGANEKDAPCLDYMSPRINTTVTALGTHTQYIYTVSGGHAIYLYFDNGRLSSKQKF